VLGTLSLTGGIDAKCMATQNAPIYDPERFGNRTFVSVITATYDLVREP
jgi:hypothetical protein